MIINLTQHAATPDQVAAGVIDLPPARQAQLVAWLTFDALPTAADIKDRAVAIAALATFNGVAETGDDDVDNVADDPVFLSAMIGGAPYLMSQLEGALIDQGVRPLYAFSRREVDEKQQPDGSTRKVAVFRHLGFVTAQTWWGA